MKVFFVMEGRPQLSKRGLSISLSCRAARPEHRATPSTLTWPFLNIVRSYLTKSPRVLHAVETTLWHLDAGASRVSLTENHGKERGAQLILLSPEDEREARSALPRIQRGTIKRGIVKVIEIVRKRLGQNHEIEHCR